MSPIHTIDLYGTYSPHVSENEQSKILTTQPEKCVVAVVAKNILDDPTYFEQWAEIKNQQLIKIREKAEKIKNKVAEIGPTASLDQIREIPKSVDSVYVATKAKNLQGGKIPKEQMIVKLCKDRWEDETVILRNGDQLPLRLKFSQFTGIARHEVILPDKRVFIYDGQWENGKAEGFGSCYWTNPEGKKTSYAGEFHLGIRQGYGKIKDAMNSYRGMWFNGKEHGWGKRKCKNGNSYEGQFSRGQPSGKGKMTYANGDIFEGEWKDGKKEGTGTMTYADGRRYTGQWKNGAPQGEILLEYVASYKERKENDCEAAGNVDPCTPEEKSMNMSQRN